MAKNLILVPILACLAQIWVQKFFLMLYIVVSYHCMQFQGKLMKQTWENGKKPSFGPTLAQI